MEIRRIFRVSRILSYKMYLFASQNSVNFARLLNNFLRDVTSLRHINHDRMLRCNMELYEATSRISPYSTININQFDSLLLLLLYSFKILI